MEKEPPPQSILGLVQTCNITRLELIRLLYPQLFEQLLNKQEMGHGIHSRAPLHLAIENGKLELVQLLLSWGADPHMQLSNGDTALTIACARNRLAEAKELLARKVNPNIRGCYEVPALWHACLMGSIELVNALLDAGADVNLTCSRGTPLQAACLRRSPEILERILVAGGKSDPTVPTSALLLPWRNISLLRKLMERGVKVSVDLEGEPLALMHSITAMAKDPESYLYVMGKDALDVFLPYVIDMHLRATEQAQRMAKKNALRELEDERQRTLVEARVRRTCLGGGVLVVGKDVLDSEHDDEEDDEAGGVQRQDEEMHDGEVRTDEDEDEEELEEAEAEEENKNSRRNQWKPRLRRRYPRRRDRDAPTPRGRTRRGRRGGAR